MAHIKINEDDINFFLNIPFDSEDEFIDDLDSNDLENFSLEQVHNNIYNFKTISCMIFLFLYFYNT